jgi:hypothetical protein
MSIAFEQLFNSKNILDKISPWGYQKSPSLSMEKTF